MIPKHHVKQEACTTRPAYRDGRKLTSVKVYTVHQESKYLLVQNVPAVGAKDQLAKLLSEYGAIEDLHPLDEYPADKFTEVYLVKFNKIQSARFAKKKLDDHSFFGGSLHICYAPEHETVRETRQKLQDRRRVIAAKVRKLEQESESSSSVRTTAASSSLSAPPSSDGLSVTSQQTPALPPPPSTFQPPSPTGPPPPLPPPTLSDSAAIPPPSFVTPAFHPRIESHPSPQTRMPHPFQRTDIAPLGYGPNVVDQNRHDVTPDPAFQDMTFQIPPPPVQGVGFDASQYRTPHFTRKDYNFAWVPSANSSFPPGYDPRLPQERAETNDVRNTDSDFQAKGSSNISSAGSDRTTEANRLQLVRSASDSTSGSPSKVAVSSSGKIIVKQYKPKGPPPRFLPRQIKDGKNIKSGETNVTAKVRTVKEKEDEVNREIRKEAFRLGKDQGPSLPSDPETREQVLGQRPLVDPKVEASVVSSVKTIRKRMSKFISETVPKQLKRSAEIQSAKSADGNGSSNS